VLIFTGYKLCEPRIWRHVAHIGREQLLVFAATVLATLCTDLLWGIAVGIVVKLLVNAWFGHTVTCQRSAPEGVPSKRRLPNVHRVLEQFHNPVARRELLGNVYHVYFDKSLVCFNNLQVNNELKRIPPEAKEIYLHLTKVVSLIDHTSCENLLHFAEECDCSGRARVEILGMDEMWKRSAFPSCMRLANPIAADLNNGNTSTRVSAADTDSVNHEAVLHLGTTAQSCSAVFQEVQGGRPVDAKQTARLDALTELSLSPDGSDDHDPDSEMCRLALLTKNPMTDKLPLDLFHPC